MIFGSDAKRKAAKAKVNKRNYIKLRSLYTYTHTHTHNKIKRQPTEWKKIFANDISNKESVSQIYEDLIQLNSKKQNRTKNPNNPIKNEQRR